MTPRGPGDRSNLDAMFPNTDVRAAWVNVLGYSDGPLQYGKDVCRVKVLSWGQLANDTGSCGSNWVSCVERTVV